MEERIKALVAAMTLEEKASLTIGRDFWHTNGVERLGIPPISLHDGPHGVRKARSGTDMGFDPYPATCFPTASATASSWNTELMDDIGRAIGVECQALDVQVLLGPGLNMKRTPLGGRNFEYFSEDPVLSGEMASAFVRGVQSCGVGACLKHYACNNQEFERMTMSSEVDERTLREIYLAGFERAVKKADPWAVMAAYNRVNGIYATEHTELLRSILKNEWGFPGLVVSDWGAVANKEQALSAGTDLEMPGAGNQEKIVAAVARGELPEAVLDEAVGRILRIVFQVAVKQNISTSFDQAKHHALARRAAAESIVLLKNEEGLLPLNVQTLGSCAVIGRFAKHPRYQGAGSSQIIPTQLDTPFDELARLVGDKMELHYAQGYSEGEVSDDDLLQEAVGLATSSDVAILFAGLPERFESEGFDRKHMDLPIAHNRLIEEICRVQKNTVVVLANGSAVVMPWVDGPKAIVEAWLSGQAGGGAIADVLLGIVNPSGKLAETFPVRLSDTPAYLNYPGEDDRVRYGEGLFVGYRYYDKKEIRPLFPFGHGLSYTTFAYTGMELDKTQMTDGDTLRVKVKVRNTGEHGGQEVVQLYVRDVESRLVRPCKELKAFAKVHLKPGEEKEVSFFLENRDFAYFDSASRSWCAESGEFDILVGSSSRTILQQARVTMQAESRAKVRFHRLMPMKHFLRHSVAREAMMPWLSQSPVPLNFDAPEPDFFTAMVLDTPIIKMAAFSQGLFTEEMIDAWLEQVNALVDAE